MGKDLKDHPFPVPLPREVTHQEVSRVSEAAILTLCPLCQLPAVPLVRVSKWSHAVLFFLEFSLP